MVGVISSYIEHFTYLGLFVILMLCGLGLPMPEDVALLAGGFLAHKGVARYPITLIVALLGVIAGDNSLYFIGRGVGSNLLSYFGLKRAAPRTRSIGCMPSCIVTAIWRFSMRDSSRDFAR